MYTYIPAYVITTTSRYATNTISDTDTDTDTDNHSTWKGKAKKYLAQLVKKSGAVDNFSRLHTLALEVMCVL